jgi:urease accessory protein
MRLSGPSLPLGSFAWSRGLEAAVSRGLCPGPGGLGAHLSGVLRHSLGPSDLPLLAASVRAAASGDADLFSELVDLSLAVRDGRESRLEEEEGGRAVARLMADLRIRPDFLPGDFSFGLVPGFAALALGLGLTGGDAGLILLAFVSSWLQNQLAAAARLMRIGQGALQAIHSELVPEAALVCRRALRLPPHMLGAGLVGLSILSSRHQDDPGRLFRS